VRRSRGRGGSVERFKDEVRIARQISHRSVCRVHDLGDRDGPGLPVDGMDPGGDAAAVIASGGCAEPDRAIAIAAEIAGALDAMTKRSNFWNGRRGWDTRATTSRTNPDLRPLHGLRANRRIVELAG